MTDPGLRARLAALDPAQDLAPLGTGERIAVLERAARDGRRLPRSRRTGLRIAIGGLVASAAVTTGVATVLPMPATRPGPAPQRTVTLSMASEVAVMCLPVGDFAPDALASSTIALVGTVSAVEQEQVDVRVDRLYRGGPATAVVLRVPANAEDPTGFAVGEHVLVAGQGGQVLGCGLSGEASPELQRFYDAAF